PSAFAARLLTARRLDRAPPRRLHTTREPPWRARVRHLPRQRERGRIAPRRAFLAIRPHARDRRPHSPRVARQPGLPADARFAPDRRVISSPACGSETPSEFSSGSCWVSPPWVAGRARPA